MKPQKTWFALSALMLLTLHGLSGAALNVLLTVKDGASAGNIANYPVKAGVPLPLGAYDDISRFRVTDAGGTTVPAQFDVLARWVPRSNSIRVVLVQFAASVTSAGSTAYYLKDDGVGNASAGITIAEDGSKYSVNAGKLVFEVKKNAFNIIDRLSYDANNNGSFEATEEMISPDPQNGGVLTDSNNTVLYGSAKTSLKYTFEERGPLRMVLRVESATDTGSANGWGFVCRVYAYYNQPMVRVDYYLKNSAYGATGHHLYFNKFSLVSKLQNLGSATVRLGGDRGSNAGAYQAALSAETNLAATGWKSYSVNGTPAAGFCAGYADISDANKGVMVAVRNFSELYPTELSVTANKEIHANLWPLGRHRLNDQARREHQILYYFHAGTAVQADLLFQAKLFQNYPVPMLMPYWYSHTRALGDNGGIYPNDSTWNPACWNAPDSSAFVANQDVGWQNWGGSAWRRMSSTTGGMPGYASYVVACGKPAAIYSVENFALHTAGMRPMWMDDYQYPRDKGMLQIAYPPGVGMRQPGVALQLDSTCWSSWDDAHVWIHEVIDYYYFSGDRFVKDYLTMHADFYLNERNYPNSGLLWKQQESWDRTVAEPMNVVVDAYKATGEPRFWNYLNAWADHIRTYLTSKYCAFTGAPWHAGYITDALSDVYFMLPETTPKERELKEEVLLAMEGNSNCQFYWGGGEGSCPNSRGHQYYWLWADDTTYTPAAPGSAYTWAQAIAMPGLMYFLMGDSAYRQSIGLLSNVYCAAPGTVADFSSTGDGYYRLSSAAWYHPEMKKAVLPAKVTTLSAASSFENKVVLRWTSVGGNEYRIHWASKPIVEPTFALAGFQIPYPDTNRAVNVNIYRTHAIDVPVKPQAAGNIEEVVLGPFPDSMAGRTIYFDVQAVNIVTEADMARSPLSNTASITLNSGTLAAGPAFTVDAQYKSGIAPLTVNFTCTVTSGTAASYAWYFGDGTTATTQNPQHVYSAPGEYKAVCVVKNAGNNATSHSLAISATAHLAIKDAAAMGPAEVYVVLNGKLKADALSPIVVSLVDKTTGAVLSVTAVKQETGSGSILSFTTAGLVQGDVYEATVSNMKADVEVAPSVDVSSFVFTASFKPNRYSVRKLNIAPNGYHVTGWEDCHSWDGDYGINYPGWAGYSMGGGAAATALDSAKASSIAITPTVYTPLVFGDAWLRVRVSDDIKDYRLSVMTGAPAWAPRFVWLQIDDSLVWDSVACNTSNYQSDGAFDSLSNIPWRIETGFLNVYFSQLCYVIVTPVTNFSAIAFSLDVEKNRDNISLTEAGLRPNYPNPFNPVTTIAFSTGRMEAAALANAHLRLYDVKGRLVRELTPAGLMPGRLYRVQWAGRDAFERPVASGIYVVKLTMGNRVFTRRVLMVK